MISMPYYRRNPEPSARSVMNDLSEVLQGLSPKQRALLELRLRQRQQAAPPAEQISPRRKTSDLLPLSFAQQGLWFIDQLQPGSTSFNIPVAVRLTGRLDTAAFERALTETVRRHEILRTTFKSVAGQAFQFIAPPQPFALPLTDLSALAAGLHQAELRRLIAADTQQPFDLAAGPLLRARLIRFAEQEHVVLFTIHHIISDGLALGILVRELATLYEAFTHGQPSPLAELPIQYADYALWQRERLTGAALATQLAYWQRQLAGAPALLTLNGARPRPARQSFRGATEAQRLPPVLAAALKDFSRREGVTLFMLLLAVFKVLLGQRAAQAEIVVGSPLANRNRIELEGLIGLFTNPLVLRTSLAGDPEFREVLARVREVTLGAHSHQEVPFQKLVEELQVPRNLSYHPLYQVAFTLDNPPPHTVELPGLTLQAVETGGGTVQLDLILHVADSGQELLAFWQYSTDLFDAATITALTADYRALLEHVLARPEARLSELHAALGEAHAQQRKARDQEIAELGWHKLKQVRRKAVS
jgi:Condensation domain